MYTTVSTQTVAVFICPSEINPTPATPGGKGVTNYAWCVGDWYVWGGFGAPKTRSAFNPNLSRRLSEFIDGTSNSLLATEVKTYQVELRDCGGLAQISDPANIPPPNADPYTVAPEYAGGSCTLKTTGHTEWMDGAIMETGMTTAWTPNKQILGGPSRDADIDLIGIRETKGGPTFAALNARSYHPGGVNALFGDGSVKFIKYAISGPAWRAVGTVNGGEVVGADAY